MDAQIITSDSAVATTPNKSSQTYFNIKTDFVKVYKLREKLEALLELSSKLAQDAGARVLLVLENAVRVGWCLIDIKAEFKHGEFDNYAEHHLPFSKVKVVRLMRASRNFQRDSQNHEFIESITTVPLALSYSDSTLVDQIKETGARHFQDLLVTSGLAPAKQTADPSQRMRPTGLFLLTRAIDTACGRLSRFQLESDIDDWSEADREIVKRKLLPLIELYERLDDTVGL